MSDILKMILVKQGAKKIIFLTQSNKNIKYFGGNIAYKSENQLYSLFWIFLRRFVVNIILYIINQLFK